ncbi:MAG: MalY/PatB family protein [Prevotellaceae bacterium]|nr:MalY/PatB family protein [Prevotellaceae bacterium]
MRQYDFDKITNRIGTDSYKWDSWDASMKDGKEAIALWVADMDFETAPCVKEAVLKRVEHGCFGYSYVPDSYYQSTIDWFHRRHGWQMKKEWFIYTPGVVPAVSAIIKAMTQPGDKVLMHTPAYNCFFSSIRNNGCVVEEIPVSLDDFEKHCADPKVKVFLLCNPHNPTGHVWRREEMAEMAEICHRHGVFVISDEIHCEFINPDMDIRYTPFGTVAVDENYVVCTSPSKAFNIAGLQIANMIIPDRRIHIKVNRAVNINEVCDVGPLGITALQAAYTTEGEEWLTQLNRYIYDNYNIVKRFIEDNLPKWKVYPLEGTYLMWVDVEETGMSGDELTKQILENTNVYINGGAMYGDKKCIRINLATQRARLMEALERIKEIKEYANN